MATVGRPRTATVLKLHTGSARHDASKLRDDAATNPGGTPEALDWLDLDPEEKAAFNWLVQYATLKSVHSHADSLLIAKLAKQIVASQKIDATLRQYGPVMKNPRTQKPELMPYFYAAKSLHEQIRTLMSELGMTPIARLKFAPPLAATPPGAKSWDDIA